MLSLYRYLSVFVLLFVGMNLQAQTCLPAPVGGDDCSTAPLMSCNLDGYMGSSGGYTPGPPPSGFCGLVENDQYFRFIVDESPVAIQIVPSGCTTAKGLQAALYETADCNTLSPVSLCASFGFVNSLNVVAPNAVVGQELYLLIDGFEGDVCDFTINVIQGILPDVEALADDAEICLGNQIQLDGTASTQRTNVEYFWTTTDGNIVSGANTMEPTIDAVGEYSLLVIDIESCCIDSVTVNVTENTSSPTFNFAPDNKITCVDLDVTLDPGLTNPANFTYNWTTVDGTIDPGSTASDMTIVVTSDGTYTVEVLDLTTSCTYTQDVVVTLDNMDPDVVVASTNDLDCNNTSTSIAANSTTPGLSYSWTGPNMFTSTANTFMGSDPGTYTVIVTAANGCTNTSSVTVNSTGNPDASISKDRDLTCVVTDATLSGFSTTPGITYTWTGPAGAPLGNMDEITVSNPGTYTLVVSLPNGCSTTVTEIIDQDDDLPDVSAVASNDLDCNVTSASLLGASTTTGASYSWTGPNGFSSIDPQPTVTAGGGYILVVTGPNGCTDNVNITVNVDADTPISDAGNTDLIDCATTMVSIGGGTTSLGPDFTYAWTLTGDPNILGTDPTLDVSNGGSYTLMVTNTNNNCVAMDTVMIDENNDLPIVDAGSDASLTCSMRSVDLGGASSMGPEFTYAWTDENGVVVSNDMVYNTTLVGTYQLQVTNTITNCVDVDMVIVDEDPYEPVAVVNNPDEITCGDPTIMLESVGSTSGPGIEYEWFDNNNALISTDPSTPIGTPGSYRLVVTDTNFGCADSIIVRVDENITPPLGSAGVDMNIDCVSDEVTLQGNVAGNMSDFNFVWFDSAGDQVATGASYTTDVPDNYELVITNIANQCSIQSTAVVDDIRVLPDADAGMSATVSCAQQMVEIGGANSSIGNNFSHQWFNSAGDLVGNTPLIMVDQADTYQLVVTNVASNCSQQQTVVVSEDKVDPQAAIAPTSTITCADPTAQLDGNLSTASNGTLAYEWLDPMGNVISNLPTTGATNAGSYTLTVMDTQNGCDHSVTIDVAIDTISPVVEVTNPEIINCYNNFVEVNYNSVNGPITPIWTDLSGVQLSTEETFLATQIGTVVLQATSQTNGCVSMASIDIVEDKVAPEAIIADPSTLTCVVEQADLIPTITNFTTDALYSWTNNLGDTLSREEILSVSNSGDYTLEITNISNGCTANFFTNVVEDREDPVAVINNLENRIDCHQPSIDIDASQSTGNAPLNYTWTNNDNDVISNLEAFQLAEGGAITLLVTNSINGCTATTDVDIFEDLEEPVVEFNPLDKLTCVENTVLVESVVTGSNNSFAYVWEGPGSAGIVSGQNDANATVELIGSYSVTVTDQINGCTSIGQITVEEDRILPDLTVEPVSQLNCVTDQVTIDASNSSSGDEFSYTWTGPNVISGEGTSIIEVDEQGDYSLLVINTETGCENTLEVAVEENEDRPVGATLIMEDPTCYGERDGLLDVSSVSGGAAPYLYAVNSRTNFTDISTYNNLPSGEYTLIIQDDIGCEWDTLFQILDPEPVTADLGADQVIRLGESSELFVETTGDVVTIAWTDNGVAGPIDIDFREIQPLRTTTYIVVVTNEEGCQGTDNVIVEVEDDRRVYFPNAFSPNGDGVNDYFTVFTDIAAQEVSSLQIFDRWGNQVFERNNFMPNIPELGWDGVFRGQQMQVGNYVYSAFIEFKDGNKINFKGEITIVY